MAHLGEGSPLDLLTISTFGENGWRGYYRTDLADVCIYVVITYIAEYASTG